MIVYYENSIGEKINLLKKPYRTITADLFDSNWEESVDGYEKAISIDVFDDRSRLSENMETLYKVFAYDAANETYGRLYVNNTYLYCRMRKSKKSGWKGFVYAAVDITLYAPALEWISESRKNFYPQSKEKTVSTGLDFPLDFKFDFKKNENGLVVWEVEHIMNNDFSMLIYGPCTDPEIIINGHKYKVYGTLHDGEYLIVNSSNCSVIKYLVDGRTEDLFDERGEDIFEKIPSGNLMITWSGEFGFDIILYKVRREPEW